MSFEHSRRWPIGACIAAGMAMVAACVVALGPNASASAASRVSTRGFPSGAGQPGIFTETCRFSHEAADDPILMPGQTGRAMHHDFFGNLATDATSTASSLRGGPSSCATSADASAYWTPVLYQDGRALTPIRTLIYWMRPAALANETVHAIPPGLQMIAGDETADQPQGIRHIAWGCAQPAIRPSARHAVPENCPAGHDLRLTITFPSCWDGHTLSAGHGDNVVDPAPGRGGCPSSHPVLIPRIVLHVIYPTSRAAGLSLSMSPTMTGSTDTAHGDFIDGWRQPVLDRDIAACVATSTRCGPVKGAQATPRGPTAAERRRLA